MKTFFLRALAPLALVLATVGVADAQTTALFFDSQPGDYIGLGQSHTWTPADLNFSVSSASTSWIVLSATNFTTSPFTYWYLNFRSPQGSTLTPGTYERAERAPFRSPPLPGLDVSGSGGGCNELTGRFVVYEIVFTGTTLTSFAADFEQHCEGVTPALFGAIRYNSTRATLNPFDGAYPSYSLTVQPAINGYVTAAGINCGAGHTDCTEAFGALTNVTLTPAASAGFVFLGWAGDCSGTATATVAVDRPRLCIPVFNSQAGSGTQNPNYGAGAIFLDDPARSSRSRQQIVHLASLGDFRVTGSATSGISVNFDASPGTSWSMTFYPAAGTALAVGDYPFTSSTSGVPGPRLSTSCATGGRFRIYELTVSGSTVTSFSADFEQPCGTNPGGMLTGAIRYGAIRSSLLPFDGVYPLYALRVEPRVGGRIAGGGIDCGAGSTDCDETYVSSTTVTLQALPSPGYEFLAWGGACLAHSDSATIVVDRTRKCTAYFQPAAGSVAPADPTFANRMFFRYQPGAPATPGTTNLQRRAWTAADASFGVYSYDSRQVYVDVTGENGSSWITLGVPSTASVLGPGYYDEAYYTPNSLYPMLRISTEGSDSCTVGRFRIYELTYGSGQVQSFAADFETLCSPNGPVYGSVRYNSSRAAVRPFDGAFPDYTLSITPSAQGFVTGPGINCGAGGRTDCSETYTSASTISLAATPSAGRVFLGWRGACDGTATTTVTVSMTKRCAAVFIAPNGTAATQEPSLSSGALFIDSDAGDTVGGGRRHLWSADAVVTAYTYSRNSISVDVVQPDSARWTLDFRAPSGSDLAVGMYENATYPGSGTGPGFRIASPNTYCSSPLSRFQIHEITIDTGQYGGLVVTAFAADFEQHCNGATAALRGAIRFNSSRPNLIPFAVTSNPSTSLGIVLGLGAPGAGWIATRSGVPASYGPLPWTRLPWGAFNDTGKGVRVAAGDVDGDGFDELVVGLESGGNGWIAVLDDAQHDFALIKWLQVPWPTYNAGNGEVWPAVGDVDGDGRAEIVAGLGAGAGGWFAIFDDASTDFALIGWRQVGWPAYNAGNGSTHPAIADVDGVSPAEIILGLGPGSSGWIEVFSGSDGGYSYQSWMQVPWAGYNSTNGETFVAAGDLDGDGYAEIVAGLGRGGWGYFHIFDDANSGYASIAWRRTSWAAYNNDVAGGETHPAVGDIDGDGRAEIILGLGPVPGAGGWFEILDDNGAANASIGWRSVAWGAFTTAGGGMFPTAGRFR